MLDFMRSILGAALKDNNNITKGVITGITRISQASIFSDLNNLKVFSMLSDRFGQYFGFTEDEVKKLLLEDNHSEKLDEIRTWYDGYQIGEYKLYNPWSIINCVDENYKFESYWLNTSDNALIKDQLLKGHAGIKETFIKLLQDKHVEQPFVDNLIFPDLENSEEVIWSLLHSAGYLNVNAAKFVDWVKMFELSIPNKEVKFVYDSIITNIFRKTLKLETYKHFISCLVAGDVETFKAILESYICQYGSFFDFNQNTPEQVFHGFMLGIVVGLRDEYVITSDLESGFGRYDLALIPKDKSKQGMFLEFKTADTEKKMLSEAKKGLSQIKTKRYTAIFKQSEIQNVLLLCLVFSGKQVELASEEVSV